MGIGAGGSITQQIDRDPQNPKIYDLQAGKRIYIHFINAGAWRDWTGLEAPISPVDKEAYKNHSIPWYDIYNEPEPATDLGSGFSQIRSVNDIDSEDRTDWIDFDEHNESGTHSHEGDEALFKARWEQEDEGKIVDIDASGRLRPRAKNKMALSTSCTPMTLPSSMHSRTATKWTLEFNNVSGLTK